MNETNTTDAPRVTYTDHLPDLITEEDYHDPPERQRVRVRLTITPNGVEMLGDSMYAHRIEELFHGLGADEIERMLCG
ncbi:MAG: radical SAM-modified peptide, FtsH ternary system-associated [Capsulimonadaceae bacterium]